MDIEKILDQLLMPPPMGSIPDQLPDIGGGNLDRSHGSSSSNSSWISESSCGCHSPRNSLNKSKIVFYKRPILQPLLCGTLRTEMQSYKHQAIVQEQKKKKNLRGTLMTRVEAILSSIDHSDSSVSPESKKSSPKIHFTHSTACEYPTNKLLLEENISASEQSVSPSESLQQDKDANDDTAEILEHEHEEVVNMNPGDSSSSSDRSFQADVYRQSLQNLLQKSINSSLNDTFTKQETNKPEITKCSDIVSSSTSSTTENAWAENTLATVVPKSDQESSSIVTPVTSISPENLTKTVASPSDNSDTDMAASVLVDSILEEVRSELTAYASFQMSSLVESESHLKASTLQSKDDCFSMQFSQFPLPKVIIDPTKESSCVEIHSSNDSNNTTTHINKALDIIENQLSCNTLETAIQTQTIENASFPSCKSVTSSISSPATVNIATETADLSSVISPETLSLITSYQHALESTESFENNNDCVDCVESQMAIVNNNITYKTNASDKSLSEGNITTTTIESVCKINSGRVFARRTRSNSYSIDAPSPLLVSSRAEHTIFSVGDETGSETTETETSLFARDVKRRLEMPSDSEESSVSQPRIEKKGIGQVTGQSQVEYCKVLEEHHKTEMLELQKIHEQQLLALQQDDAKTHIRWCKLSALVKGYLTRQLLGSRPVQTIMQTIRDSSRAILAIKSEERASASDSNMDSIQDATLLDRLFLQLQASLFEFHDTFFRTTLQDRMDIIANSRKFELHHIKKVKTQSTNSKTQRLSSATLKSLQRKQQTKRSTRNSAMQEKERLKKSPLQKSGSKEVKSKISHLWKANPKSNKLQPRKEKCIDVEKPTRVVGSTKNHVPRHTGKHVLAPSS